ncbi:DNA-binding protein [Paraburkholderia sp. Ac-20347]|uniref:DNA-binding protein n=1 Tax=Paraburkholderia sp. Ac-20347 TaxID=2703892 RepID=UPI00198144BE|nr:DNA-binding protein [Paraburkholderia sp. Ac-20347]MBN3811685.1 DNA-binding protein [Paraburkholderia sp. Ac-20347]
MSTIEQTIPLAIARMPIVEKALREAIADPKKKQAILEATGWDPTMPSQILAGRTGITLEKLDKLFSAIGLVVTTVGYMDYLAEGNVIGSNCRCARMSMGACGAAA